MRLLVTTMSPLVTSFPFIVTMARCRLIEPVSRSLVVVSGVEARGLVRRLRRRRRIGLGLARELSARRGIGDRRRRRRHVVQSRMAHTRPVSDFPSASNRGNHRRRATIAPARSPRRVGMLIDGVAPPVTGAA
jgi:hypothetical protein